MIENKILYYLKTECTGIDRAVTSDELCSLFDISSRELRQIKRRIVLNIDVHVGSTENGFWYAENHNEVGMFMADYISRSEKYQVMINRYKKHIKPKDQGRLF